MEKDIHHANNHTKKRAEVAILISDKIDFKIKTVTKRHFMMIKQSERRQVQQQLETSISPSSKMDKRRQKTWKKYYKPSRPNRHLQNTEQRQITHPSQVYTKHSPQRLCQAEKQAPINL